MAETAETVENTDRLAQEEVAELFVLQGQPDRALPLLAEVLARQPYRHDVRDRMESLEAACRQSEARLDTRPIPVEALAGAHEEAGRPDKALALLTPLLDLRPDDAALQAWVVRLKRRVGGAAAWILALAGLLTAAAPPAHAAAGTSAVAALRSGDRAATEFAAALLAEELRARGQATIAADGWAAATCADTDTTCLRGVTRAVNADDLYLLDVRTGADRWTVHMARFTPSAGTVERTRATLEGSPQTRSSGLRSRLLRFLRNPATGRRQGALLVRSTPPGARVFIDGDEAGPAPLIIDDLYAGLHLVAARRADRAPAERTAMVEALGLKEVVVPLSPGHDGFARPGGVTLFLTGLAVSGALGGALVGNAVSATQVELDTLGRLHIDNVERASELAEQGRSQALTATILWSAAGAALLGAALSYWRDWGAGDAPATPPASPPVTP